MLFCRDEADLGVKITPRIWLLAFGQAAADFERTFLSLNWTPPSQGSARLVISLSPEDITFASIVYWKRATYASTSGLQGERPMLDATLTPVPRIMLIRPRLRRAMFAAVHLRQLISLAK
jgi:hypothetical protein